VDAHDADGRIRPPRHRRGQRPEAARPGLTKPQAVRGRRCCRCRTSPRHCRRTAVAAPAPSTAGERHRRCRRRGTIHRARPFPGAPPAAASTCRKSLHRGILTTTYALTTVPLTYRGGSDGQAAGPAPTRPVPQGTAGMEYHAVRPTIRAGPADPPYGLQACGLAALQMPGVRAVAGRYVARGMNRGNSIALCSPVR
jgi:hypothetical protein